MTFQTSTFVEVTTQQTATTASYVAVTNATIPSSFFSAGSKYLIVITAQPSMNDVNGAVYVRVLHNTTEFIGSEEAWENNTTTTRHSYVWFTVWTAVADEAITMEFRGSGTNQIRIDQVTMFALRLTGQDLTEGTDWTFNEDTTGDTLNTNFATLATVTFTPGADSNWLVLASARIAVNSVSSSPESRINASGSVTDTVPLYRREGEDSTGADQEFLVHTLARVYALTGGQSQTFDQQSRTETGTTPRSRSAIFALNLSKFTSHGYQYTIGNVQLGTTDFVTEVATVTFNPSVSGNCWILGGYLYQPNAAGLYCKGRLQVANADQPGTQTSDAYQQNDSYQTDDEIPFYIQTRQSISSSTAFDVDGSVESGTASNADNRIVFALSLDVEAAPPPSSQVIRTGVIGF